MKPSRWRCHSDAVFAKVDGKQLDFWRAVDHEREVLKSDVTKKWNKKAVPKFFSKAMRKHEQPDALQL